MTYSFVGEYPCSTQKFIPNVNLSQNALILQAIFPNVRSTWNKAADIFQFNELAGIGNIYAPKRLYLPLNKPTELIFAQCSAGFRIQVELPYWIDANNITLKIWEANMPIFSEVSPTTPPSDSYANKLPTAVAASTTVASVAANSLRKGLIIRNRGTQGVNVGYNDPAVSASTAAFVVPANSTYEVPTHGIFTGILHFVTAAGTTNLVVTELMN